MFYQLLESIKQRPTFFLPEPSVIGLHTFLLGWQAAKSAYHLPQDEDERDFAEFQPWVAHRFGVSTTQSWPRIIRFFASDERASLDLFFKLLADYRARPSSETMRAVEWDEEVHHDQREPLPVG